MQEEVDLVSGKAEQKLQISKGNRYEIPRIPVEERLKQQKEETPVEAPKKLPRTRYKPITEENWFPEFRRNNFVRAKYSPFNLTKAKVEKMEAKGELVKGKADRNRRNRLRRQSKGKPVADPNHSKNLFDVFEAIEAAARRTRGEHDSTYLASDPIFSFDIEAGIPSKVVGRPNRQIKVVRIDDNESDNKRRQKKSTGVGALFTQRPKSG